MSILICMLQWHGVPHRVLTITWCDPGPSTVSKAQLAQQLVQEFPKAFQLVSIHSTPAYGQAAPSEVSADPQAGGNVIITAADFQVRVAALHVHLSNWSFALQWSAHQHQTTISPGSPDMIETSVFTCDHVTSTMLQPMPFRHSFCSSCPQHPLVTL